MAILSNNIKWQDPWQLPDIPPIVQNQVIQGDMLVYSLNISEYKLMTMRGHPKSAEEMVKDMLIEGLIYECYKTKYIEFTKQENLLTGATDFRARMFVTPDNMVRIIRQCKS
jgi:hypothetical protein